MLVAVVVAVDVSEVVAVVVGVERWHSVKVSSWNESKASLRISTLESH